MVAIRRGLKGRREVTRTWTGRGGRIRLQFRCALNEAEMPRDYSRRRASPHSHCYSSGRALIMSLIRCNALACDYFTVRMCEQTLQRDA